MMQKVGLLQRKARGGMLKSNRAFLLFEVMIAAVVLAVGITLVLRSFNTSIMAIKGLQDYSKAMFLAQEKMFQLETEGIEKTGREGKFDDKFAWEIDSVAVEDVPLDKVKIDVVWNTADSNRTFSVQTYMEHK